MQRPSWQAALSSQRMREVEEWIWKAEAREACHWVAFPEEIAGFRGIDRYLRLHGNGIYHSYPFNLE